MERQKKMNDQERDEVLSKINNNVDELLRWKFALDARCKAHREQTNELRKTIYGNPGRTNGLQFETSRLTNSGKRLKKFKEFWIFILKILLITGIISIVTWLLQIYKGE